MRFYNQRGKAELWIKEGKQAVKITPLSCSRYRSNEIRASKLDRLQPRQIVAEPAKRGIPVEAG